MKDPEKDKLSTFPRRSLSGSISLALMLLDKVSRAGVDVKTAATALGYPTINGATKTTLAALRIYGLIDKPHGKDLVVPSETLIRLHTASSEDEKREICRSLAMKPPLFSEMHQEGLNPDDRPLLIRWLLMQNYSERLAEKGRQPLPGECQVCRLGQLRRTIPVAAFCGNSATETPTSWPAGGCASQGQGFCGHLQFCPGHLRCNVDFQPGGFRRG